MPETTVGGQPQLGLMVDYFQLIFEQELERVLEAKRQMEKVFEESKSRVESELEDLRRLIQATTPVKVRIQNHTSLCFPAIETAISSLLCNAERSFFFNGSDANELQSRSMMTTETKAR